MARFNQREIFFAFLDSEPKNPGKLAGNLAREKEVPRVANIAQLKNTKCRVCYSYIVPMFFFSRLLGGNGCSIS